MLLPWNRSNPTNGKRFDKVTTCSMSNEMFQKLETIAERERVSLSSIIRFSLENFIKNWNKVEQKG